MEPILATFDSLKRVRAMFPIFLLTVSVSWSLAASVNNDTSGNGTKNCVALNRVLLEQSHACRCFDNTAFSTNFDPSDKDEELDGSGLAVLGQDDPASSFWIGCSRDKMPAIFKALTALPNETNLTQLWIWDGFIPRMPARSFATVRPKKLIIERCHTGDFNGIDVFAPLADRLTELELKNNVLTDISAELLAPLRRLVRLDLSVNYFSRITNATFGKSLPSLRSLSLYRNQIEQIADGALDNLQQLRSLNLANNRLTRITAATFGNLRHLEYLNLENNQISEIDDNAFLHLTNLRVLNLGGNRLKSVNFPAAMPRLRQLFLNNNTFQSLDDIRTAPDSMPALETLHLDQNQLKSLGSDKPKGGLKQWPTLQVLSVASNQLSTLDIDDLSGLKKLRTLSLQGNQLTRLGDNESGIGPFVNLPTLTELFLSRNQLSSLGERTFDGLYGLRVLTVARNKLESVDEKAFNGLMHLEKLFLNDNNLKYLSNVTLGAVQSTLSIIDLSDNPWQCDCKLLWLIKWIADPQGNVIVNSRQTTCHEQQQQQQHDSHARAMMEMAGDLITSCESGKPGSVQPGKNPYADGGWDSDMLVPSSNNVWITVLGIVLGVVSICILLAVSYLYFQDTAKGGGVWRVGDSGGVTSSVFGRWTATGVVLRSEHALRRVPSDMVNLIPKCSTNSSSAASTTGEKM